MNKVTTAVMLVGLLAAFLGQPEATAQDRIYKWVDDEGVVHYTARPPDNVEYEELGVETEADDESAATDTATANGNADSADEPASGDGNDNAPLTTIDPEQLAADCEQSRTNLANLTDGTNIVMRNDDGTQRRIGEDKRQELIEQSQQFIDRWCSDQTQPDN